MESEYEEDLEVNPFYLALKESQEELFRQIERESLFVCVPQRAAIQFDDPSAFTLQLCKTQIIRPQGEGSSVYETLNGQLLHCDGHTIQIRRENGFGEDRDVQILFEELFYGESNHFRVFCVDRLLEGGHAMPVDSDSNAIALTKKSLAECREFFRSFPENSTPLSHLDMSIVQLAQHASIKKRTWKRVKAFILSIFENAARSLMENNELFKSFNSSRSQHDRLMQYLEMYIMGSLHIQIYSEITMQFAGEDSHLVSIMETLQPLPLSDFGVQELFVISDSLLIEPVDHIASLDDFQTPIEKLFCIRDTVNLILRAVEKHFRLKEEANGIEGGRPGSYPAISTDDLLPLFIYITIKSHPVHLYSNFYYMKNFQFSDIAKHSDLSFHFSTFQASLEYLRSSGIKDLLQRAQEGSGNDEALKHFEAFLKTPNLDQINEDQPDQEGREENRKSLFMSWLTQQDSRAPPEDPTSPGIVSSPTAGNESEQPGNTAPQPRTRRSASDTPSPKKMNPESLKKYFTSSPSRPLSVFQLRRSVSSNDAKDFLGEATADSSLDPTMVEGFSEKRFFKAVEDEDLETLRSCVASDKANPLPGQITDVDTKNDQGFTALHLAAVHGLKDIAAFLLEKGAEVSKKTRHGATALHLSSQYNQSEVVKVLLTRRETDVNAIDKYGNTPLHMACSNGHLEPARLLLHSKANHLFKNLRGETPLHLACKWGSEEIVELLFLEGKKTGKGTGVNDVTQEGNSPLHLVNNELLGALLLRNGGKLTIQNEGGLTPLHKACQYGSVGLCELFLQNNARVNALDSGKRTPLHSATCEGQTMTCQLLIEKYGADVNAKSRNGNTPLHAATANGKVETVAYLLSRGSDARIKNVRGQTPPQLVGKNPEMRIVYDRYFADMGRSESSSSLSDLF